MNVVVVESPAKAKTINKYLGSGYTVLASYGHVRDLPPKDGSVRPDDDFSMSWEVDDRGEKRMKEIVRALKGADHLFLATDPDREGEAISWHVNEELLRRHADRIGRRHPAAATRRDRRLGKRQGGGAGPAVLGAGAGRERRRISGFGAGADRRAAGSDTGRG